MLDGGLSRVPQPVDRRPVRRPEQSRRYSDHQPSLDTDSGGANQPNPTRPQAEPRGNRSGSRFTKPVIVGLVIALACLLGWMAWTNLGGGSAATIDSSKNQAVFFAGGQVYFGKLEIIDNDHLKLSEVFYIQSGGAGEDAEGGNPQQATDGELQLIKLGEEVHGPEDAMIINRDQVLFFENLKTDSRVSQLIQNYKSGQ